MKPMRTLANPVVAIAIVLICGTAGVVGGRLVDHIWD
jgi:hypothetical protein